MCRRTFGDSHRMCICTVSPPRGLPYDAKYFPKKCFGSVSVTIEERLTYLLSELSETSGKLTVEEAVR